MAHAATAAHIAVDLDAASTAAAGDETGTGRCHEVEDVLQNKMWLLSTIACGKRG